MKGPKPFERTKERFCRGSFCEQMWNLWKIGEDEKGARWFLRAGGNDG